MPFPGHFSAAINIEAEVRANPELRADRFVQAWRRHMAERERLKGWEHDGARGAVEDRMKALAKGIDKDPAMAKALGQRAGNLGLGKQWTLEWRPGSRDGGIGHDMIERMRAPSMAQQLIDSLSRGRDLGMSR